MVVLAVVLDERRQRRGWASGQGFATAGPRRAVRRARKEAHLATMCRLAVVLPRLWRDTALPGALEPPPPTPPPAPPPSTVSRSLARDMPSLPLSRLAVPATLHAGRHATQRKGVRADGQQLPLSRLSVPAALQVHTQAAPQS